MVEQLKLALTEAADLSKSIRAAQRALAESAKALDQADSKPLADLAKKVTILEGVAGRAAVQRALPTVGGAALAARERLEQLGRDRADVVKRRDQLARIARADGMPISQRDRHDWVGPFRIDHVEAQSTIRFGSVVLGRIKAPSGAQLITFLKQCKKKLDEEAARGWDEFIEAAQARQQAISASEYVRWRELVEATIPDPKQRRRLSRVLLYRLAQLVFSKAPGGWSFVCAPPTLAEQRQAVEIPDFDHPGESTRVARGRLHKAP